MLLLIDNYDSFTYNLSQYIETLGCPVVVKRNDTITLNDIKALSPQAILISPGPCTPNESGISLDVIQHFAGHIPILGVCLGHQSIAQVFGGEVCRATQVMHGKTSMIEHHQTGVFQDLPSPFRVARYHSLIVEPTSLPDCLEVTAWYLQEDDTIEIMGLRHKTHMIEGVQFHPEAILSQHGHQLLANFLQASGIVLNTSV
ncbi:anthranilate synthase component II [Algicola sagamiensis]|uniref:anthranilate synthase component II n=1 Tax=Algicola sagamiensis TaxID=163869 RepID=UPI00037DF636|nr:aminodeoxychorismate/anthranilate synthase component II [Algicola sagamiensis]